MSATTDRLWEEIVFIAYHLHWSFDSILDLDHASRAKVIEEIGRLNRRATRDSFEAVGSGSFEAVGSRR